MIGIDGLASNQLIAALIAAILYFLTYVSFVRLLRYWRNWYPPTRSSTLVTGGLALATVAYISISPHGLSLLALALAAGFIACLFGIIAAPAIAFEPGAPRPVVELLAKHGEYAGLWMIPPAILAGFVLPDARLLVVTA
jgi:multisubunit Na+/H+ antiporter MnhG subunit